MARIPREGDQLGPYRITRELGAGGMGVVFEAIEENLGRRVALKVLAIQLAEEPEFRARFAREATVLARSDSPHIIQVYSHGEQDGCLYLATQFISGGDLAARVRQDGLPGPEAAVDITAQVASALADAHAVGVVHRDVKPQNVLLRPGQGQVHAYLCDFGIARDDESSLTQSGLIAGTYAYLAPERFRGEPATPASDIYALGCLLWFLLTGRPPYEGGMVQLAQQHELAPVPQLPGASAQVNAFLRRAMAKDPRDRYPSAAEAAAALRAIRTGGELSTREFAVPLPQEQLTVATPPPLREQPTPLTAAAHQLSRASSGPDEPRRSRRRAVPLVVALLVLALGIGGGVAWNALRDDAPDQVTAGRLGPGARFDAYTPADVDGDGTDDTILVDEAADRTLVLGSTAEGFGTPKPWAETAYAGARVVRGDFTGDGLADVALVDADRIRVARSTGAGFADAGRWAEVTLPERFKVTAGDFDGDGRTDLAFLTGDGEDQIDLEVAVSDGSSFAGPTPWSTVAGWEFERTRIGAGDVDGDGGADLVALVELSGGGVGVNVLTSEESEFGEHQEWFREPSWDWKETHQMLGDYDGDGDADLLVMRNRDGRPGFAVLDSRDGELTLQKSTEITDATYGEVAPVSADTDGDGRSDLVFLDRLAGEVRQFRYDDGELVEKDHVSVPVDADSTILVGISR